MRKLPRKTADAQVVVDFFAESRITTTGRAARGREGALTVFARILADLARRKAQQERE